MKNKKKKQQKKFKNGKLQVDFIYPVYFSLFYFILTHLC